MNGLQSGPQQGPEPPPRALPPITVDEALPYSPLSSIIPFDAGPIPFPTSRTLTSTPLFSTTSEHDAARQTISGLNDEAFRTNYSSAFLRKTVQDLQSFIKTEELTHIRFKFSPTASIARRRSTPGSAVNGPVVNRPLLGTFAEMVFGSTDVRYKNPTPAKSNSRNSKPKATTTSKKSSHVPDQTSTTEKGAPNLAESKPQSLTSIKPALESQHVTLPRQDAAIEKDQVVQSGSTARGSISEGPRLQHGVIKVSELDLLIPDRKKPSFAVVVPSLPLSSQPEEYQTFPDSSSSEEDVPLPPTSKTPAADQRQKSQMSLKALLDLINDAFEVEDQLQGDTSGNLAKYASEIFSASNGTDDGLPTLAPGMLVKLDTAILKVISDHRFADVPVDDLARLQRLCDGSLKPAETIDLRFQDDWSDEDYTSWESRLVVASTGLKAARAIMRIMTCGREEKMLSSEEMINSILSVLKNVVDSFIIPVVELRSSGPRTDAFAALTARFKIITALFNQSSKLLNLLVDLLGKEEVTEGVITTAEFLACGLIFVENSPSDKDSILGVQRFERFRVISMNVLIRIFERYPDQRTFVFDEILTSLERLPVTRQAARHFKLIEGGNIQLVSALMLKLVQTSAIRTAGSESQTRHRRLIADDVEGGKGLENDADAEGEEDDEDTEAQAKQLPERAMRRLSLLTSSLLETAQKNAQYVIQFLVSRALRSTKSGDDPYRLLLDIFTEDLITVLSSPEWPAAELLLRLLLTNMVSIAEGEKSAAPAKNMALDLMGLMGSAISDMVGHIRQSSRLLEHSEAGLDGLLGRLTEVYLEGKVDDKELTAWGGPYRATLQFCRQRIVDEDQTESSQGYYMTQWASKLTTTYTATDEGADTERARRDLGRLAFRLRRMVMDSRWLERESTFDHVSTTQGRLAYALTVLNMPFCKAFERILLILLNSMNSDQATVRSKSMKSVIQLLEKDPTILDRGAYVMRSILTRTCDPSPLVRDSAVGLVGKCLTLKPALEGQIWDSILARVTDAQVGVRKRSMKILKSIYLRSEKKEVKSAIAEALLHRVKDSDEGVSELARQVFEEIWVTPFHRSTSSDSETSRDKVALTEQVFLIIKTVQRGESVSAVLDSLLRSVLSAESKVAAANARVCKNMVSIMFDAFLDEVGEDRDRPSQAHILRTLTVFAKASPKLFSGDQLEVLLPYLENLSTTDDLQVYRSAVIIFRWVLPQQSSLKNQILLVVQGALLTSLSKLGKRELTEVIPCLWTINGVLNNIERLCRATISCIKGVYTLRQTDLAVTGPGSNAAAKVIKYMTIAGLFGKYCDFTSDGARFRAELPWWKGDVVPSLMVDVFAIFTRPKQPIAVRSAALEALGAVCHAWPKAFLKEQVYTAFDIVFMEGDRHLESIVLLGIREFLTSEERRSEKRAEIPNGDDVETEAGRLGGALVANQNDGVSSSLAQRYLQHIIRIATATQDLHALAAVEVIGSISRQGLLHPKECGPVLVALEGSQNATIAGIAFREHRTLHQKHETVLEKEYMKAVTQAYLYQRDIVGDALGASSHPFTSKLRSLYDIIKISKLKLRKKFLASLCSRIDFDPAKLDVGVEGDVPPHLQFCRFLLDNMAFFEYNTVDEVLHVIACIERVVTTTGTSVAHAIETEIFAVVSIAGEVSEVVDNGEPPKIAEFKSADEQKPTAALLPSDDARFRRLTTASMILCMMWDVRSFLRRLYGFLGGNKHRDSKSKISIKDLNKNPAKVPGITGDKLWEGMSKTMASLSSAETMTAQLRLFVDLLSVDHDFKVAADADADDDAAVRPDTPSGDDADEPPNGTAASNQNGRRKRQAGSETPGGRKGKRKRRSSTSNKKGSEDENDTDWI